MFTNIQSKTAAGRLLLAGVVVLLAACSGTPESREAARMKKGKEYFENRDYRKAVIEFKIAAQNMPKQIGRAHV